MLTPVSFAAVTKAWHRCRDHRVSSIWPFLLSTWLCVAAPTATAQSQAGATESMRATDLPASAPQRQRIGDATTALLDMQADNRAAAPTLPMLGAPANLSWRRYLDSFKQPIPETFSGTVRKNSGSK